MFELAPFHRRALIFMLHAIFSRRAGQHPVSNTWCTRTSKPHPPFHLAWPSWVRQQVTHANLILQPPEKQAPTNTCPLRTRLALGLAIVLPGLRTISEGHCHAGYADDDPQNTSAALGWQSKQAGFPRVKRGVRLPMVLMLQVKAYQELLLCNSSHCVLVPKPA